MSLNILLKHPYYNMWIKRTWTQPSEIQLQFTNINQQVDNKKLVSAKCWPRKKKKNELWRAE